MKRQLPLKHIKKRHIQEGKRIRHEFLASYDAGNGRVITMALPGYIRVKDIPDVLCEEE